METAKNKIHALLIHHKITALWEHGMFMDNFRFGTKNDKKIIEYLQATFEKYAEYNCAKSVVYRTIRRIKTTPADTHLDPMRDRRGENKPSPKRKNSAIVALCDELLALPKTNAPKVQRQLEARGITISAKTVQRIAEDLKFLWTKPWDTDVLTPAQQKKCFIVCNNLLMLSEEELLLEISS